MLPDYDAKFSEALAFYKAKEYDKAYPMFMELTKANYIKNMAYLGECYEKGHGVEENMEVIVIWYKVGVDHGESRVQACLGWCYEHGKCGIEKDTAKVLELYQNQRFGAF